MPTYADTLGALTLPVAAPSTTDTPIGDPLRAKLGAFLKAAVEAGCSTAWTKIGGGTAVVERVEVNDPNDNTFVTTKLPCLVVMRGQRNRKPQFIAEDMRYRETQVLALWVPPVAVQHYRAARESFYQAVEAAVDAAVWRGRTSGWIDTGDTDPLATTEGSLIETRLGLLRPLAYGMEFSDVDVTVEMVGATAKKYPALQMAFSIWEQETLDFTKVVNTGEFELEINDGTDTQDQTFPLPA